MGHSFFIFFNPTSGDRQGRRLEKFGVESIILKQSVNGDESGQAAFELHMHNVLDTHDYERGMEHVKFLCMDADEDRDIVICSAGGDGTFVALVKNMLRYEINLSKLVFTAIPFGTGNDLCQAFKWGRYMSRHTTRHLESFMKEIILRFNLGEVDLLDIWKIDVIGGDESTISMVNKQLDVSHSKTLIMTNYMTFGLQGVVGFALEQNRHKSRFCNILEYMKQCVKIIFKQDLEKVCDYVSYINENENKYSFNPAKKKGCVELIIQNNKGIWGRQVNLWDKLKNSGTNFIPVNGAADPNAWTPSQMNDGLLEMFAIASKKDYLLKQFPFIIKHTHLDKLGQFKNFRIKFKPFHKVHMMIDGEFFQLENIQEVQVNHLTKIKILKRREEDK